MAVDPSDALDNPYGLGECVENIYAINLSCSAMFADRTRMFTISMRKRGDFVQIIFPEFLFEPETDNIDIISFSLPNDDTWLGKNRTSRRFGCVGMNGCEVNTDNMTNEICVCQIDIDFDGNVYIAPKDSPTGFKGGKYNDQVGTFSTTISYLVDDSEPEEEEEAEVEPQAKVQKVRKVV